MGKKGGKKETPDAGAAAEAADPRAADALKAAKNGDERKLAKILDSAPHVVGAAKKSGQTLLMLAIEARAPEVVDLLLDRGAKVDAADQQGQTALHYAMLNEEDLVVAELIKRGAKLHAQDKAGETPLHVAARLASEQAVRIASILLVPEDFNDLINAGGEDCDGDSDDDGARGAPGFTLKDSDVLTALQRTTADEGLTVLHEAASEPECADFALLVIDRLNELCGKNQREKLLNLPSKRGTPLAVACGVGNVEVAKRLLAEGADVAVESDEGSALHLAAMYGSLELVEALLEVDSSPGYVNKRSAEQQQTALFCAAVNGRKEVATRLLGVEGIDVEAADAEGDRPITAAWMSGHLAMVELLAAHGASREGLSDQDMAKRAARPAAEVAAEVEKKKKKEVVEEAGATKEEVEERLQRAMEARRNEPERYELNCHTILFLLFISLTVVAGVLQAAMSMGWWSPED